MLRRFLLSPEGARHLVMLLREGGGKSVQGRRATHLLLRGLPHLHSSDLADLWPLVKVLTLSIKKNYFPNAYGGKGKPSRS